MGNPKIKRIRVFAGPNGSGKTTIIKNFPKKIPLGIYINADDIEKEVKEKGFLDLKKYGLKSNTSEIRNFIKTILRIELIILSVFRF